MRLAASMSVLACICAAVVGARSACASPAKTAEESRAENEERRQSVIAELERRQCPYQAVVIEKGGRCVLSLVGIDIGDLAPLAGLPVDHIVLRGCAQVRDLTPLKGMRLGKGWGEGMKWGKPET